MLREEGRLLEVPEVHLSLDLLTQLEAHLLYELVEVDCLLFLVLEVVFEVGPDLSCKVNGTLSWSLVLNPRFWV